jgi:hypothetical protein
VKVSLVDASALSEPDFELSGGFDDVHARNDSYGEMGSQMAEGASPREGTLRLSFRAGSDTEKTEEGKNKNSQYVLSASGVKGLRPGRIYDAHHAER